MQNRGDWKAAIRDRLLIFIAAAAIVLVISKAVTNKMEVAETNARATPTARTPAHDE